MSSTDPAPAALSRPGSAVTRAFPVVMVAAALVLAAWVALGRAAVGVLGALTPVYAVALALPLLVLHVVAAALLRRDSLNYPSHAVTRRAVLTALAAWLVTAGFGFFLPDSTAEGMRSVFTHVAGARYLELGYGFVNILGVLSVALAVALVLLAVTELRVTGRRLGGEPLTEDERLDRLEARERDDAARAPHGPPPQALPDHRPRDHESSHPASAVPGSGEPGPESTPGARS